MIEQLSDAQIKALREWPRPPRQAIIAALKRKGCIDTAGKLTLLGRWATLQINGVDAALHCIERMRPTIDHLMNTSGV